MTKSDLKPEIMPTLDHLSDPYVLQLIEALSRLTDEIEDLQEQPMHYGVWHEAWNSCCTLHNIDITERERERCRTASAKSCYVGKL